MRIRFSTLGAGSSSVHLAAQKPKRRRPGRIAQARPSQDPAPEFRLPKTFHEALVPLYVLFALLSCGLFVWKLPAFMGPDEPNHLRRADQIARGEIFGRRFQSGPQVASGGTVDTNLDAAIAIFEPLKFSPDRHVTPQQKIAADMIPWGAVTVTEPFSNTAAYPPLFYLPASVAVAAGKTRNDTIVATLNLARVFNALACVAVGAFALKTAGRARLFLFCLLLLPMSLEMDSVVTQDGLIIAVSALACAYMIRGPAEGRVTSREEMLAAGICLFLVGITKPPYALLAFLLLLVKTEKPSWRWVAFAAVFLPAALWDIAVAAFIQTPILRPDAKVDEPGQIAFVLHHPMALITVPLQTLRTHLSELIGGIIGNLGWLDTPLPKPYDAFAYLALAAGGAAVFTGLTRRGGWTLVVLLMTGAAVVLGLYLAYTPVGSASADGVQGRYFLPLLAFLPLALIGKPSPEVDPKWARPISYAIGIGFPLVGMVVIAHALTTRYYG